MSVSCVICCKFPDPCQTGILRRQDGGKILEECLKIVSNEHNISLKWYGWTYTSLQATASSERFLYFHGILHVILALLSSQCLSLVISLLP